MNRKKSTAEKPLGTTLTEHVYQQILNWINEGVLHPNERLREAEVCDQLGVSRTPVREAIRRLQAEGRVTIEAQRGAVVAELGSHEVVEIYTLRLELEGFAARLAAQHATDAEIQLLEALLDRSRELSHDLRALNDNNWKLHRAIRIAAHNRFLSQAFDSLAGSLALLRGIKYIPDSRPDSLLKEHQAIVDAIKRRDPSAACEAAQYHIEQSFQLHMITSLNTSQGGF